MMMMMMTGRGSNLTARARSIYATASASSLLSCLILLEFLNVPLPDLVIFCLIVRYCGLDRSFFRSLTAVIVYIFTLHVCGRYCGLKRSFVHFLMIVCGVNR